MFNFLFQKYGLQSWKVEGACGSTSLVTCWHRKSECLDLRRLNLDNTHNMKLSKFTVLLAPSWVGCPGGDGGVRCDGNGGKVLWRFLLTPFPPFTTLPVCIRIFSDIWEHCGEMERESVWTNKSQGYFRGYSAMASLSDTHTHTRPLTGFCRL